MKNSIIKAWRGTKGVNVEIGTRTLMTDKFVQEINEKAFSAMEGMIISAMSLKLIHDSLVPQCIELIKQREPLASAWDLYATIDATVYPTLLPLALKMEKLLRHASRLFEKKRISRERKKEWLDMLEGIVR